MDVYKRLNELKVELLPAQTPSGPYAFGVITEGNLLFSSGANCRKNGVPICSGKVGRDVTLEQSQECAKQCIINMLSNLHFSIGNLNRIKRVVKILGLVSSDENFYEQPKVLNAASDLLIQIFGEDGRAARSAIGVAALPGNIPVEIEVVFELSDG